MRVKGTEIGPGCAPVVIAEVGQCHEGQLGQALRLVKAAALAGAWGIKLQLLTPERIAAPVASKYWDHGDSRDQRQVFTDNGPPLSDSDLVEIRNTAWASGLTIGATPFDEIEAHRIDDLQLDWVKVASGDITNGPLLDAVAGIGFPTFLSTGASRLVDIEWAYGRLRTVPLCLLACSLEYPTPRARAAIGRVRRLQRGYPRVPIGYSDHTLGSWAGGIAAAAGACVLEKHFSLGGHLPVPDHEMAVNAEELRQYCADAFDAWLACSIDQLGAHEGEVAALAGARRSWYAVRDLAEGTQVVHHEDVELLRPNVSAALDGSVDIWNLRLSRSVKEGAPILWKDIQ